MKTLTKLTLSLAALTIAGTATAADRFTYEGRSYTYTTKTNADGSTVIEGRSAPGGRFSLVVRDGKVTGHSNNQPVAFSLVEARGAARGAKPGAPVAVAAAAND